MINQVIWVVVSVKQGIAHEVGVYSERDLAVAAYDALKAGYNEEEDDLKLFGPFDFKIKPKA